MDKHASGPGGDRSLQPLPSTPRSTAEHTASPVSQHRASVRKLPQQFSLVSSGNIIAALLQAGSYIILARWATLAEFGIVTSFLAFVVIVQTAADLGVPIFVIRQRGADPTDPAIPAALRLNNWTSFAISVLIGVAIVVLAIGRDPWFFQLAPLALWAAAERNTDVWLGVTLADGQAHINAMALVVRRFSALVGFVLLYALEVPVVLAFALGYTITAVTVNQWAHRLIQSRLLTTGESPPLRGLLRSCRPYWFNSIAAQARNADVLITGALAGAHQAAFYAAASRVTGPLRILPTSLASVIVPATANDGHLSRRLMKAIASLLGVVSILYVAVALVVPYVVPTLLGQEYLGAVVPLQIISCGLVFAAAASVFGSVLQGLGAPAQTAKATAVSTTACLVGVAIAAPTFGAIGAAYALAASFVLQCIVLGCFLLTLRRRNRAGRARP